MTDEMIQGIFEVDLKRRWTQLGILGVDTLLKDPRTGHYREWSIQNEWEAFKRGFEMAMGAAILGLVEVPEPPPSPDLAP